MNMLRGLFVVLCAFCWISTSAFAGNLVVTVPPPNGTDDTAAIQGALNQCLGPNAGCTVQLAAGTYLTRQLFTEDFHGTFKGKGMDATIIQALPGLVVSQDDPVWINPPSVSNPYPMLVLFFGGDISVSDMAIRVLEINPALGWYSGEAGAPAPTTGLWGILEFMSHSEEMNVVVNRVALKGAYDESVPGWDHYNTAGLSIEPYPPFVIPSSEHVQGTIRVTASRFDTVVEGIWATIFLKARLILGGSPSEGNLVQNCDFGILVADLDSSVLDCTYNDVSVVGPSAFAGIVVGQSWVGPIETSSPVLIRHNRIKATGSYEDGIWVFDYGPLFGEGKTGDFVVANNTIVIEPSETSPALAGIQTDFTVGTVFSNNRIVGSGLFGILTEGDSQAMLKANNVQQVVADVAPIGLMTNLWFAPDLVLPTTDSTVVGFGNKTNVYDEGVNNTLVGVNNMRGNPPGPAVRDAMKRKIEMLKSMRKP